MVEEPTVEDTISILRGLKDRYEVYHGVKIMDNALVSAAVLSNRYITDRFLPDKAIDLVDEACALIKTEMDSMPTELDELQRKVTQLEIEETALKKEDDRISKERLADLQKELAELKDQFNTRKAQWDNEKASVDKLSKLREDRDRINNEIQIAEREGDYEKAGRLKIQRNFLHWRNSWSRRKIRSANRICRWYMKRCLRKRSQGSFPAGPAYR